MSKRLLGMCRTFFFGSVISIGILLVHAKSTEAQSSERLETRLKKVPLSQLVEESNQYGNAQRGALLFYRPELNCAKCHRVKEGVDSQLGPELEKLGEETKVEHLIESLLTPSAKIREGYSTIALTDLDGQTSQFLLVEENKDSIVYRDVDSGKKKTVKKDDLDDWSTSKISIMPEGLVNQLKTQQEFYDIVRYLAEIAKGGPQRAMQLMPVGVSLEPEPLPEYETRVDHAGLIADLNNDSIKRGQEIYKLNCQSCHGTKDEEGSMPTSLRFASGKFKRGSDPYSMYQTLTHGYAMMVPQRWMVPRQKYDVIHFIRETMVKPHNQSQYRAVEDQYLASLPKGNTRGPKPIDRRPWQQMDYGPMMMNTIEIGQRGTNIAQKGIAVQLDNNPGGIAQGKHWMIYDHDTMRVAGAWSGVGFIDWKGIHFDGQHNIHPRAVGRLHFQNESMPGWLNPSNPNQEDQRIVGRDGKRYGPLPREWVQFKGLSNYGNQTLLHYTVGESSVLELPALSYAGQSPVFQRVFNIGPRKNPLTLQVLRDRNLKRVGDAEGQKIVLAPQGAATDAKMEAPKTEFDGTTGYVIGDADSIDMKNSDFTIVARVRTRKGGTIFSKSPPEGDWAPDGKTVFVRDGRLTYDIGWVGAVTSKRRINDGRWHNVAVTWRKSDGRVQFFIDGKLDQTGTLKPEGREKKLVGKIGFTNDNFPQKSFFEGQISNLVYFQSLSDEGLSKRFNFNKPGESAVVSFRINPKDATIKDRIKNLVAKRFGGETAEPGTPVKFVAVSEELQKAGMKWITTPEGDLRLQIAAGHEPVRFTLSLGSATSVESGKQLVSKVNIAKPTANLQSMTKGGPSRWPNTFETKIETKFDQGPFAVDYLTHPAKTPWNCRMRLTGLDFFKDPNVCAVSAWDGSIWLVTGLQSKDKTLTWKRIASGLFQPLGVRIIDEKIYCTCRDQLVLLHDVNGDDEIDFFECFNSDHQVTEHFHEFAMGLQTDEEGNFYYAKSARHAKEPLVPHHGTLLKISKDGKSTEILAYGFRAANGVCLNPDGTFIVTDQEGHWNPKNRINWVTKGGFYGNMWGYHDITDSSDEKMDKPLCWITNSFDRSPSELMWVNGPAKWGPLNGSLLNFSYGYGKVYVVPHENVSGQMQGGMVELPIPQFPTGVMRGRFSPADGQLYCCGMFAWAGNQTNPGGLYRIRYTGKEVYLPKSLKAKSRFIEIGFSGKLDRGAVEKLSNYSVRTWHIKRTRNYGSRHFDEKSLKVEKAELLDDGKTIRIYINDLKPTRCMEIKYELKSEDGTPVFGNMHNTIHELGR